MCPIRRISKEGRITIPTEFLKALNMNYKDEITVDLKGNQLIFEKVVMTCFRCDNELDLIPAGNLFICKKCIRKLNKEIKTSR